MKLNNNQAEAAKKTMDPYITDSKSDPAAHPSYPVFFDRLTGQNIDPAEAEKLWELLIQGFRTQHSHGDEGGFEEFARRAYADGLLSTGSEPLALWSGGFDMSVIAQQMGYCTLEKTVIGKLLDETPLTSLWDLEKHLWNRISERFVGGYTGDVAHVYFQTVDDKSVLNRQELPQLDRLDQKGGLRLHPIYLTNKYAADLIDRYAEVGLDGRAINIDPRNHGIPVKERAWLDLQEMLRTRPYAEVKRAIESADSKYFDPGRPPFAQG